MNLPEGAIFWTTETDPKVIQKIADALIKRGAELEKAMQKRFKQLAEGKTK